MVPVLVMSASQKSAGSVEPKTQCNWSGVGSRAMFREERKYSNNFIALQCNEITQHS